MRAHIRREGGRPTTARSGACSPTSSAPPPRTCSSERRSPQRPSCCDDRGEAAASDDFFRSPPVPRRRGRTHTLRIETDEASSGAADRPRDRRRPRPRRDLPLRLPRPRPPPRAVAVRRRIGRRPRSRLDPAEIDFSATGLVSVFLRDRLGEPPLAGADRAQRGPDRRPGAAAEEPAQRPPPDPPQPEAGYELDARPRRRDDAPRSAPASSTLYEQTMRRTDAAGALLLRRRLLRPRCSSRAHLARPRPAPGGEPAAASIAAVSDGFLHYYLSGTADAHLARLADEERLRRADRARRRARPAAQPRRRHRARRRPRGVQARLRQPPSSPCTPRRSSATPRPTSGSAPAATPAGSSPPTARLAARSSSGSAGVGPVKVKAPAGSPPYLPQVALPKARIASRVAGPCRSGSRAAWSRWWPRPRRASFRWGRAASPRTSCRRRPSEPAGRLRADPARTGSPAARARASGRRRFPPASRA